MTLEEVTGRVLGALDAAGIPHMLVGGLTTNYYGIPRATQDVDVVVQLNSPGLLEAVETTLGAEFHLGRLRVVQAQVPPD